MKLHCDDCARAYLLLAEWDQNFWLDVKWDLCNCARKHNLRGIGAFWAVGAHMLCNDEGGRQRDIAPSPC